MSGGLGELVLHTYDKNLKINTLFGSQLCSRELKTFSFDENDCCILDSYGDIVNDIYLVLDFESLSFLDEYTSLSVCKNKILYDIISNIKLYSCSGGVLEQFSGNTMYINSLIDKRSFVTYNKKKGGGYTVVYALNFCIKEIPLVRLRYPGIKIDVKLNSKYTASLLNKYLDVNCIFLDSGDRKKYVRCIQIDYPVNIKNETSFKITPGDTKIILDLRKAIAGDIRDIFIYLKSSKGFIIKDALKLVSLYQNKMLRETYKSIYLNDIFPRQYNTIFPDDVYVVPFDLRPIDQYPKGFYPANRVEHLELSIDLQENHNIDEIIICSRRYTNLISSACVLSVQHFKPVIEVPVIEKNEISPTSNELIKETSVKIDATNSKCHIM